MLATKPRIMKHQIILTFCTNSSLYVKTSRNDAGLSVEGRSVLATACKPSLVRWLFYCRSLHFVRTTLVLLEQHSAFSNLTFRDLKFILLYKKSQNIKILTFILAYHFLTLRDFHFSIFLEYYFAAFWTDPLNSTTHIIRKILKKIEKYHFGSFLSSLLIFTNLKGNAPLTPYILNFFSTHT